MEARQSISKTRREYSKWVKDQTLEDFALRFTAKKARNLSIGAVGKTALGATAFLALEALSAAATLQYGFINTLFAMFAVAAAIVLTGLPIAYHAARSGLDIDLLTRGAGFGYLGSTVTSLIYATFTFIFFAIEAAQARNFPTNKKASSLDVYLGKQFPFSAIEDNIFLGQVLKNGAVCDGKPRAMAFAGGR